MYVFVIWDVICNPVPELLNVIGNVGSTNATCNDAPNHSCDWALKKQMINGFNRITEATCGVSIPSSFYHIVFC